MVRKVRYEWAESESFTSGFACGSEKFNNVIFGPIVNLVPNLPRVFVFIVSWLILLFMFLLVYYVLPISIVNSSDGQYVDTGRSIGFAFLFYYIFSAVLIALLNNKGCSSITDQATAYLYDPAPPFPATLIDSAE
jgi:hypothetical protein